jgi:hypothetical protein
MAIPNTAGEMRMVMSCWAPKDDELAKNPILRELRTFSQRAYQGTDMSAAAQKMFGQTPAMGPASKMMGVFKDTPVLLRMNMSIFVPGMAEKLPGAGDSPLMQMTMDMAELSAAEIPDSIFAIPREYSVVTVGEALQGMQTQMMPARSEPAKH